MSPNVLIKSLQVIRNKISTLQLLSKNLSLIYHKLSRKKKRFNSRIHSKSWCRLRKKMLKGTWIARWRGMFGNIKLVRVWLKMKSHMFKIWLKKLHNCFKSLPPRKNGLTQTKIRIELSSSKTIITNTGTWWTTCQRGK